MSNLRLLVHIRIKKHFNDTTKGYCLVLCQTGLVFMGHPVRFNLTIDPFTKRH